MLSRKSTNQYDSQEDDVSTDNQTSEEELSSATTQEESIDDSDTEEDILSDVEISNLSEADPLKVLTMDKNLIPFAREATADYYKLKSHRSSQIIFRNPNKKTTAGDIKTYVLFPSQYVVAQVFLKTTGVTFFRARMGFGKTLVACYTALQCMRALIVVPTGPMGPTWSSEIEDYGLYNSKPSLTKIFIYDTVIAQTHRIYLENTKFGPTDQLIIVCKDASVVAALDVFQKSGLQGHEFTVIVDEGHMRKIPVLTYLQPLFESKTLPVTRELLLSASNIDLRVNGFKAFYNIRGGRGYQIDHRIVSNISNKVPNTIWHFEMMASNRYAEDSPEWIKTIQRIAKLYTHPVFVGTKEENENIITQGAFGSKAIFKMTQAKGKIPKFENSKNAVMFLNKVQVTGMNINGDAMIITNPGAASTEYILQLLGRIVRPKNKLKNVHIYLLCGSNKEFFRCLYAKAFSFDNWEFPRDSDVNASMVAKGVGFIRALGVSPLEINKVDLCVILADYLSLEPEGVDAQYMIDWWVENTKNQQIPSVLTKNMILDLVTL